MRIGMRGLQPDASSTFAELKKDVEPMPPRFCRQRSSRRST
jgi:hypothetical protein